MVYRDSDRTVWVMTGVGVCYLELSALSTGKNPLVFKPADYTLLSVYPNPFNSETRIRYDLLKRESVEISVYDLQGRLVETLADEVQSAGRHELNLAMRDVASGVYFVQLRTSEAHRVQKVVLLK